jgi:hypothetical protein
MAAFVVIPRYRFQETRSRFADANAARTHVRMAAFAKAQVSNRVKRRSLLRAKARSIETRPVTGPPRPHPHEPDLTAIGLISHLLHVTLVRDQNTSGSSILSIAGHEHDLPGHRTKGGAGPHCPGPARDCPSHPTGPIQPCPDD